MASWREAQLMIAEVAGGQTAVGAVNRLRELHGLPAFVSSDPEEIRQVVLEERRRELWLEGQRLGDMLRLGEPFPSGVSAAGFNYDDGACVWTMDQEVIGNPNARPN